MQALLRRSFCVGVGTACCGLNHCATLFGACRYCPGTPKDGSPAAESSVVKLPDGLDGDEDMTLDVYRPFDAKDAPRHDATKRFLYTLVTTPDEQEWKDMLAAAIRLNTWREHHLRAVLRSVHQTQYDVDGKTVVRGVSKATGCTPATRLQRAVNVVQAAVDEGYRPAPESVHALLVALISGALREVGDDVDEKNLQVHQQPCFLTTRTSVWQFLAWMERHNYHVMSTAVLERLGRMVEDDSPGEKTEGGRTSAVRINRVEYLQREGDRLLGCRQTSSQHGGNRRPEHAVPVPDDGCV